MKKTATLAAVAAGAAALAACAMLQPSPQDQAMKRMQEDFHAAGIVGMDRLKADTVVAACNKYDNNPPAELTARLQKEQYATVKYPADGKLLGNWKSGEKVAQNGRGMTFRDKGGVGGGCYNCHQIGPDTTSFGTIGPSLYHFGKLRGYTTEVQRYAYAKIYNAKAYSVCSQMPRFGYVHALTEDQIKDLVALLMDPNSPVNR